MINEIGWLGNLFFALGAIYLANKKTIGWYYNVLGNSCYITQGILLGLDSLWVISAFLLTINIWGIYNWRKKNG